MGRRKGDKTVIPPIEHRFKKGEAKSPEIRKKISETKKAQFLEKKSILSHTRELLQLDIETYETKIKNIQQGDKHGITVAQYIAMKSVQAGMKGDPRFIKDITDREYGTPKQSIEHSSDPEAPLAININLIKPIITPPEIE